LRLIAVLAGIVLVCLAFTSPASAGAQEVEVKATFTEPAVPSAKSGCPAAPEGFCGHGQVIPLGQAADMIEFGVGCGGTCDRRTITLSSGTIVFDETFSNGACPGSCHQNPAEVGSGNLTDVVVSGTGIFAAASGTLTGTVKAAGRQSQIKLSGVLTLDP
jgi:hypothetical protein